VIVAAGNTPCAQISIALDAAASEFYIKERQVDEVEVTIFKIGDELVNYYEALVTGHPAIVSIDEGDYPHWIKLSERISRRVQLVGDDLYTTNRATIRQGLAGKWYNALLLQ
jgi:enolase